MGFFAEYTVCGVVSSMKDDTPFISSTHLRIEKMAERVVVLDSRN